MSGMNVTAKDLVEIIKSCKNSGLKTLKYGDVELEFDTNFHPNKTKFNTSHKDVTSGGGLELPFMGALNSSFTVDDDKVSDNEVMMDDYLDQMNIENPVEHEELQLKLLNRGETVVR